MIYEGSCDTEDWSNNAENSDLLSQEYIYKFMKENRNCNL